MSDRLTDEIAEELRELVSHSEYHDWTELELQRHADIIAALSVRVDRRAMAGWWNGKCPHGNASSRYLCSVCQFEAAQKQRMGKAPWEENRKEGWRGELCYLLFGRYAVR